VTNGNSFIKAAESYAKRSGQIVGVYGGVLQDQRESASVEIESGRLDTTVGTPRCFVAEYRCCPLAYD